MKLKDFLFSKKYNSLYYKIKRFFKSKIPFISPGWYEYHFPYRYWWKARKIFKRPKVHFTFNKNKVWFFGLPIRDEYYNKILDVKMSSLGYKMKFDSPRHEWDPFISIILFNKYHFLWTFNWIDPEDEYSSTSSMATWEAIIDYLYNKVPLEKLVAYHTWLRSCKEEDKKHTITIERNMK